MAMPLSRGVPLVDNLCRSWTRSLHAKLANRSAHQVLKSVWVNCDEIEFLLPLL